MVQRQDDEHHRISRNGYHRVSLLDIGGVVPVCQENTLWVGCSSGGIADVGVIIRSDGFVPVLQFTRVILEEGVSEGKHLRHGYLIVLQIVNVIEDNDLLHSRKVCDDSPDFRKLGTGDHHEAGIRVTDAEYQVAALLQFDGKRDIDSTGIENAEFADDPEIASLREQGNPVPFFNAQRHKPGSNTIGLESCLLECSLSPMVRRLLAEEYVGGILSGIFLHEINDSQSFCHIQQKFQEQAPQCHTSIHFASPGNSPNNSESIILVTASKSSSLLPNL